MVPVPRAFDATVVHRRTAKPKHILSDCNWRSASVLKIVFIHSVLWLPFTSETFVLTMLIVMLSRSSRAVCWAERS